MTKKLAILFAAISLCACSFIGCSDDNKSNDDAKAAIGENCKNNDDCASNYCDLTNAGENNGNGKCAKSQATVNGIGGECTLNANCKDSWCKKDAGQDKGVCTARLADGQACTDGAQCEGSYCNDDLCASSPKVVKGDKTIGAACNDNNECESGYCTNYDGNGKKCANVACLNFRPNCDSSSNTAYKSCDPINGSLESENCTGGNICKPHGDNVICGPEVEEVSCHTHANCANNEDGKKLCNKNGVCAVSLYEDYCNASNCPASEGECLKGVCVSAEMKAKAQSSNTETCVAAIFPDFCNGDVLVYCNEGTVAKYDCAANKAGHCVIAMDPTDTTNETLVADCSGNADMIQRCEGKVSAKLCYAEENWHSDFFCATDLEGNDITLPDYSQFKSECVGACVYEESGKPTCAAADD